MTVMTYDKFDAIVNCLFTAMDEMFPKTVFCVIEDEPSAKRVKEEAV